MNHSFSKEGKSREKRTKENGNVTTRYPTKILVKHTERKIPMLFMDLKVIIFLFRLGKGLLPTAN